MCVNRPPAGKVIARMGWAVLIVGLASAVFFLWRYVQTSRTDVERTTLSLLRSEAVKFLVVRKTTLQVVVQYEEEDWLGHWRGVLWGVAEMLYGIDLDKVTPSDLRRDGDTILVRLPEPRLLAFSVEPGSIDMMTKSTAAPKIADLLHNGQRKLLEERFRQRAMEFATGHDLTPGKAEIVRELNQAVALFRSSGFRVRFE
ncbi:MAG: DUF4230 domain-containing protein [Planctomycetota bacterium]|nr:DUF4230 domain-containing protein [Planctomycetota bacterium]